MKNREAGKPVLCLLSNHLVLGGGEGRKFQEKKGEGGNGDWLLTNNASCKRGGVLPVRQ